MITTPNRWFRGAAVAAAAALALPACGGDDEGTADTTAPTTISADTTVELPETTTATSAPTTAPTTSMAPATTDAPTTTAAETAAGEDDDDTVVIAGIDELPQECIDALAEFLRAVEPVVADIDWDTATLADFEEISAQLEDESEILEEQSEVCDEFDFASDEESLQALIEFAEEEAPGIVGWLEFVGRLGDDFGTTGTAADGPQTCDEALAYIDSLVSQGTTMAELPVSELGAVTQAINVITTDCTPEQAQEFFEREDIADFMG